MILERFELIAAVSIVARNDTRPLIYGIDLGIVGWALFVCDRITQLKSQ